MKSSEYALLSSWIVTMIVVSPFVWSMLATFSQGQGMRLFYLEQRKLQFNVRMAIAWFFTLILIDGLSAEFFSGWISLLVFVAVFVVAAIFMRSHIRGISERLERSFMDSLTHTKEQQSIKFIDTAKKLLPWDAHLTSVVVPSDSVIVGKTLIELEMRERYGINVIAINRGGHQILTPGANDRIFPLDTLLCFASDFELDRFQRDVLGQKVSYPAHKNLDFTLRQISVSAKSPLIGKSIKDSGVFTKYSCLVVGLERMNLRVKSPKSDQKIESEDLVWVIGPAANIQRFIDEMA